MEILGHEPDTVHMNLHYIPDNGFGLPVYGEGMPTFREIDSSPGFTHFAAAATVFQVRGGRRAPAIHQRIANTRRICVFVG